ncbi:major facilitator superfamily domain-containing protein 6 jef isoform X2 [Lycorma delicatula]|uniref:major facilitator superfamily domain-containing protein 6 jef isoform X2 n=1 Tax=Lycorma delicatula TaxID=130591 RepID=UPI003F5143D8
MPTSTKRWQKGKMLLLASLSCWIIFTLPLSFIQPPPTQCLVKVNVTTYELRNPDTPKIIKREAPKWEDLDNFGKNHESPLNLDNIEENNEVFLRKTRAASHTNFFAGQSPLRIPFIKDYNEKLQKNLVKPVFSSIVYTTQDIEKAFFLLLLLVVIGEFFSAPAITLADSAVITILGEDADRYGHQRMFGSLGWGLSMFFVGIALDHSTAFPGHPCGGPDEREKNYTICFATFSVLMGAALITATQINFRYDYPPDIPEPEKQPPQPTEEDFLQQQLAQQLHLPALAENSNIPSQPAPNVGKTQIFAQTTREIPEWVTVLKYFKNLKCGSFLFVSWFMGFGIGLIFTFLFWHLQDYGGSPTLFGVASVINHISEIFAYFFSFQLITQMGHVKVLCLGLVGNILRFLYISYLKNPWWVLPFEFMQGITHAAVWAACCSYIAHNTPQHLRSSAQGVLQGIHHGLGRGCGAMIGGLFVTYFGTTATFRGYGLCCGLVLAGFIFINFYHKDTGFVTDLPVTEDPHQVAEETSHLAPHGVPSNPIPRALSSSRLHDLAQQEPPGYNATYGTTGGNLDIPGAGTGGGGSTNPFLQHQNYDYRSNKSFNTEEENIRRHFQMYSEVLAHYENINNGKYKTLTRLHTQQPIIAERTYDW